LSGSSLDGPSGLHPRSRHLALDGATREYIMAWGLSDGGRSPRIGQNIQNFHLAKIDGLDSEPQGEIKDQMTTRHDRKHNIQTEDEDKGRKSYDKGKGPA